MALPSVDAFLTSSAPVPNIQDPSAIAHVVGVSSKGPIGVPTQINSYTQLRDTFGDGPGPEQVAEQESTAGFPVYFTRTTTTTAGAAGDVTVAGGEAVAKDVYGVIIVPGSLLLASAVDVNGDVLYKAKVPGVTLTILVGGALAYSPVVGKAITLTVTVATTATEVAALALPADVAALMLAPVAQGTGASVVKQATAATLFGDVRFQAILPDVTLTVAAGALGYAVVGTDVTLTVAATDTAADVAALALGAAATLLKTPIAEGPGTAICGQAFAQTAFDLGSIAYSAKGPGGYLVPGADPNGGVIYLAKVSGAQVEHIVAGNSTPLTVAREGNKVVVNVETDGAGTEISTADEVVEAVSENEDTAALVTPTATGTGAGVVAAIAATDLDPIQIAYVIGGASTVGAVALSGRTVTVTGATDAQSEPTSTATAILALIAASANVSAVLAAALLGSGAGLAGAQTTANLTWSSASGTATLSGTPNDGYRLQMEILRGGTVGTQPYPTMRWAVDYLAGTNLTPNWTGQILIPADGVVELSGSDIDTGLTVDFAGALALGTIFTSWTTPPTSGISDMGIGVDAAIAERRFEWGFITSPDSVTRSEAAILNAKLEAAFTAGTRAVQGLWSVRDLGEGEPGETVEQYQAALDADFLGFVASRGRTSMCAGAVLHASPYTLRQFRRPTVFVAAARKGSIPVHENFGKVGSGPLVNVLYLFYDEGANPGLFDSRFIVPMTYPQRPGYFYLAGSPTMADAVAPADAGYTLYERVATANQIVRIAQLVALQYANDSLPGIARADSARGIVAGAIDSAAKGTIESRASKAINTFLFARKSDQKASASPLPINEQTVTVRQDNNFLNDQTIYMDIKWIPLGLVKHIVITVNTTIPG